MNIDIIIDAYIKTPSRNIVIISNWHISDYGKKLFDEYYNKYSNIILQNAIFDIKILNMIRSNCSLYIHSHSLCGTAPSLVEAMYLRLPIISFDVPTNRNTTENKAKYFSDSNSLVKILKKLNNSELKIISKNMYTIASRRYYWKRITKVYKNLLKSMNILIYGFGRMGLTHYAILNNLITKSNFTFIEPNKKLTFLLKNNVNVNFYSNDNELSNTKFDLSLITTPPFIHSKVFMSCIREIK